MSFLTPGESHSYVPVLGISALFYISHIKTGNCLFLLFLKAVLFSTYKTLFNLFTTFFSWEPKQITIAVRPASFAKIENK